MSSVTTLSRPYAKAAFELAREGQNLAQWDDMLTLASRIVEDDAFAGLVENPLISASRVAQVITDAAGDDFNDRFRGYLKVLADNDRLGLLPEITRLYRLQREAAERRLRVRVVSAVPLDDDQSARMRDALARRFDRDIELENVIDPGVIGGAIVYAGDEVIDGSLRGRLQKLSGSLAN